ncbi:MAG: YvcK family protein [Clostridia bacterium]|nr:YvcK family protein [Clostridia bacterium]
MANDKKIVVIGGGTGQAVFLRGLKHYSQNITAVVPVTDNGSSSGMLREDLGMLPPGDIRSCLLALAETEPTMETIFQYRFDRGRLEGQNFGNLFIAAMTEIFGSFERAVQEMGKFLSIKGKVLPVSLDDLQLSVELENGVMVQGESGIKLEVMKQKSPIKKVFITPEPTANKEVLDEIAKADIVIIGPGSLYTSILADLVIPGVADAVRKSKAKKIYVANMMTQPGETDNMTILDSIKAIEEHCGEGLIDYLICNDKRLDKEALQECKIDEEDVKTGEAYLEAMEKYEEQTASQLILTDDEREEIRNKGITIFETDLVEVKNMFIRHDAIKLSEIVVNKIEKELGRI